MKILLPVQTPVVGDFIPALAGLAMGGSLVLGIVKERGTVPAEKVDSLEKTVMTYRVPLGFAGLGAAALHFLLPQALLL